MMSVVLEIHSYLKHRLTGTAEDVVSRHYCRPVNVVSSFVYLRDGHGDLGRWENAEEIELTLVNDAYFEVVSTR